MLELRLLRYFVVTAEAGSVTGAAAAVRVAQPSLSRQLRQLEGIVGVALFDRRGRRLELSAAGLAFLPLARDLLRHAEQVENFAYTAQSAGAVSLSVVAPETTVADVIAPFLAQRGTGGPTVNVREQIPAYVFDAVTHGAADVGISSGPPPGSLASRPIIRFAVLAYVRPEDPLARHRAVRLEQLVERQLIVLGAGHGTRRVFDDAVGQAGLAYTAAAETDVPQVAQAMAAAGQGVAIVTDDRRYGLRPLAIETGRGRLTITLFGAWDPMHYAAAWIERLVDDLAAFAQLRYGSAGDPAPLRPARAPRCPSGVAPRVSAPRSKRTQKRI